MVFLTQMVPFLHTRTRALANQKVSRVLRSSYVSADPEFKKKEVHTIGN